MPGGTNPGSILVLAPHADDAEFGIGGYIHRQLREGSAQAHVAVFATGGYTRSDGRLVTATEREEETSVAMSLLGTTHNFVRAFAENDADLTGRRRLVGFVERVLADWPADETYVCLPSFNQDHGALFDATITAFRPGRFRANTRLYAYEYPGNAWGLAPPRWGRTYLRLTEDDIVAKTSALWAHRSQWDDRPTGHVSPIGAKHLAALRGSECGAPFAELVHLVCEIR